MKTRKDKANDLGLKFRINSSGTVLSWSDLPGAAPGSVLHPTIEAFDEWLTQQLNNRRRRV